MATVSEQIQEIYIGLLGRAADKTGLAYWVDQISSNNLTIEQLRANIVNEQAEYQAGLGSMTRTQVVTELYNRLFERAPEADGLEYWVNGDGASVNVDQLVLALSNGAGTDDRAVLNNKVEAAEYYTANVAAASDTDAAAAAAVADVDGTAASVTASKAATDALSGGQGFELSSGTDNLTGTSGADTFEAYLKQNAGSGGVSNSLSSADRVDGGAGTDALDVHLVPEFFGTTGDVQNQIDVQPVTSNVENVMVQVRDLANGNTSGNATVTLDAKNMTEVKKIGSSFSDGDLVIENLTTQNNGAIDLTSTMTVVMSHTDNFNSDRDASDLSVYFDEDYLNTTSTNSGSTLLIRLVNAVTNVDNKNPIFGTDSFTVMVGATTVTVDISAIAADASLDYTTAYDQVVTAINGAMANAGFPNVTAAKTTLSPTVFSIPVTVDGTDYDVGDSAGSYFPILVTNSGSEELGQGSFEQATVNTDTDINSSMTPTPTSEQEVPISINIDLEKVGRDGEGGNLVIGGKDQNLTGDTDVDQNDGIEIFNIDVLGDSDKPSNLGQILSTNGTLKTVNIETASEFVSGDSHAALTVRGEESNGTTAAHPFGGTLDTLNANDFLGDLYIGNSDLAGRAHDIETFTATGGGDVTYWTSVAESDDLTSTGNLAFSATTGSGADTINAIVDGGAQYTVTTGTGNDTVVADVQGETTSDSTQSKIIVNSAGGNNTVTLSSTDTDVNEADVTTGSGTDTVTGGATHLTVDTNAGDDVIYTQNTGDKAIVAVAAGASEIASNADTANNNGDYTSGNKTELLFGRSVRVTLDLPEDSGSANTAEEFVTGLEATAEINASNGALTTERDYYQAIADAINNDAVLNKLAKAEIDSNGNLTITYLIDGVTDADDIIQVEILGDWADLSTTEQTNIVNALQTKHSNSQIDAAEVENEYDEVDTATYVDAFATTTEGTDATTTADNKVNGGQDDDVIVLSSNDAATDTVVFDTTNTGHDTIVHFEDGAAGDVLDFTAWMDNVESPSGSAASQVRIATDLVAATAISANTVTVVDFDFVEAAYGTGTIAFASLTDTQLLAALNGTATGGDATDFVSVADASLHGTTNAKSILLIEYEGDAAGKNEGQYLVAEVTADNANAGNTGFTDVTIIGTVDFGSEQTFHVDNFA